ncbi:competence type IV pilus assembly protein ComGB [Heyndrickxia coagulans]|uniref:competence type IV pilus assembly protein ComGB n=1 Tax=Heyndrickxia coagulans TaxID=1398 RepID=UPI0017AFC052|nr:competence type IV pilus assembly protein ComGB [Heyndrickxia coagulans]MDT9756207.1 competence type IV pilus assembly protein ComGB [Heyndrickxia coagulans]NWN93454.1 type II secretion system F family protein [Bacillus sp. (in: firmicutes)]
MLENGFPIADAIDFLGHVDGELNARSMNKQLQNGTPLHDVLLKHRFDANACMQIYFAGRHGEMVAALKEAGAYLLKKHEDALAFWKLIRYPLILAAALFIATAFVRNVLLPQFEHMYVAMDYKPSRNLRLFLAIMEQAPHDILVLSNFLFLFFTLFFLYFKRKKPLAQAAWLSRLPVSRFYYTSYYSQFLAREWSFMLKSGFSVYEILHVMESQNFKPLWRDTAKYVREKLLAGETFSHALASVPFIEPQLVILVRHGEKNGRLDQELYYYSQISLKRMEEKIQSLFGLIQPVVFIFIGFFLVAIYLSIMLPMFQMIDAV